MKKLLLSQIAVVTAMTVTASAGQVEEPDSVRALAEVSVTAVKGSTGSSLMLEPVAATMVTRTEIERLNIMTMKEVSEISPNFYIPDYGSRMTSSVYMRGIGARIDQPVVGLNIDNVPFLNKDNYDFDLVDIDHIEVLLGPQSTLYGRNTMGGQINITTLSPMRYQGLRLLAEGGSHLTARAALSVYTKPSSRFGTAFSAYYNHVDGYYRNRYDNSMTGRENSASGRWKSVWAPSSALLLENTAAVTLNRQNGYAYESIASGEISCNDPCRYNRFAVSDGLTARLSLGRVSLSSITSVQYLDDDMLMDQDFLPVSYFTLRQKRHETDVTQDFVLKGSIGNYSWLGGVFFFYKDMTMRAPVTFKDYGIEKLIVENSNKFNATYPIVWSDDEFVLNSDFTNPVIGGAVYHRSTYTWQGLTAEADLRLDYEHNTLDWHSYCATGYDIMDLTDPSNPALYRHDPVVINDSGRLKASFTQLLPKFTLSYRFPRMNRSTVYASVARGYKAGGFNTQMFSDVLQQRLMSTMGLLMKYEVDEIISYKPEYSWNYEVGAKLMSRSGRLSGEAAIFYIDCRDQQLTMFPEGTTTGRIMANAGKTRSWGAELSAHWSPTDRWTANASYGFCDARFVEFYNGKASYNGKRVPYAPRNTVFASLAYRQPLQSSALVFTASARGLGSIMWDEANTVEQPFYATLGASVTWQIRNLSIKLWGENLTSTRYSTFYFVSIGNAFTQRGKPLTAGITLRYAM